MAPPLATGDQLAAIRKEGDAFYSAADRAEPDARVPACPAWSVADLVWHLAEVHWFWATVVERGITDASELQKMKGPERPGDYADVVAFGREMLDRMLDLLDGADPSTPVWTWAAQQDVGFIQRHQVQEAAVHRFDIERAAGVTATPIDPTAAADAIDEFLTFSFPVGRRSAPPLRGSIHLHCTDAEGEWLIRADGSSEAVHVKGDVALRGPASDLLLALYGRVPIESLEVIGEASIAEDMVRTTNLE